MLKKMMLSVVAVALLAGAGSSLAQEGYGNPEEMRIRKGRHNRQGLRPGQQGRDRWLAALTNAYRENDREKMGELLRNMNHRRREQRGKAEGRPWQLRKAKEGPGKDRTYLWGGHRKGKGRAKHWLERKEGRRWHGRGFECEGKGEHSEAFRGECRRKHAKAFRGKDGRKHANLFREEGIERRCRRFRGGGPRQRHKGREGQGFQDRDIDRWGRSSRRRGQDRWNQDFEDRDMRKQRQKKGHPEWDW